jgi:hypothetical protein
METESTYTGSPAGLLLDAWVKVYARRGTPECTAQCRYAEVQCDLKAGHDGRHASLVIWTDVKPAVDGEEPGLSG